MVELYCGDCLDVLRGMEGASVDAVVTDPPAGISFMGKDWDGHKGGRAEWVGWLSARLAECYRVARPGARMLCWAIPRTSHWTGTAIEDAGWTIEDRVSHLFGTGFPKHKSKLKPACEDWWLAIKPAGKAVPLGIEACRIGWDADSLAKDTSRRSSPRTDITGGSYGKASGGQVTGGYEGETASPAGRWPANVVLSHHPECREVGTRRVKAARKPTPFPAGNCNPNGIYSVAERSQVQHGDPDGLETVPAFDCHPDCAVAMLDEQSGEGRSNGAGSFQRVLTSKGYKGGGIGQRRAENHDPTPLEKPGYADSGGASRFFYISKASRADRNEGNGHPTVKCTDLMRWLVRLITQPGDIVLDPFTGSGSTGKACQLEGRSFIGIEQSAEYIEIARRRIDAAGAATPLFS